MCALMPHDQGGGGGYTERRMTMEENRIPDVSEKVRGGRGPWAKCESFSHPLHKISGASITSSLPLEQSLWYGFRALGREPMVPFRLSAAPLAGQGVCSFILYTTILPGLSSQETVYRF